MTSYIQMVNEAIVREVGIIPNVVLYGENINNGSFMSGLTRGLSVERGGRIINVGDCEPTHCGVGFGLMLNEVSAVLFAKQLDFMLLGLEQVVSTYSNIRSYRDANSLGSFTILTVVCDQGLQGPQSSFNALGDICSMARIPGFTITNVQDTARVLGTQLTRPGFRFVCLSQRLYPTEMLDLELVYSSEDCSVFQYADGEDVTIACFNFSLPHGYLLQQKLSQSGVSASLFSINHVFPMDWQPMRDSVTRTGKLVILDDSKSVSLFAHRMLHEISVECPSFQSVVVTREPDIDFGVGPDDLRIDFDDIVSRLGV